MFLWRTYQFEPQNPALSVQDVEAARRVLPRQLDACLSSVAVRVRGEWNQTPNHLSPLGCWRQDSPLSVAVLGGFAMNLDAVAVSRVDHLSASSNPSPYLADSASVCPADRPPRPRARCGRIRGPRRLDRPVRFGSTDICHTNP